MCVASVRGEGKKKDYITCDSLRFDMMGSGAAGLTASYVSEEQNPHTHVTHCTLMMMIFALMKFLFMLPSGINSVS